MSEVTQSRLGAGILGVLVLIGLIWYMAVTPPPGARPAADLPSTAFIEPVPGQIDESTQFYDIHAFYPSQTPLSVSIGSEADALAVARMRAFEEETIASFKRNGGFASLTQEDIEFLGYANGRKQELGIEYVRHESPTTVSYEFVIYEDTMGAHPNTYYRTFTFNLQTGQSVSLGDLFTPGSPYLLTLSEVSRSKLQDQIGEYLDAEYMNSGTEPNETSFQNFVIEGNILTIIFPPYQVGPYALGTQKVSIPLAELAGIKEEYK